jgi:GrpB-like predicted nucleotidyltransferase (UPF0157 family)
MHIEIHAYDSGWPALFRQTALPIRAALGDLALRIDHVGSTAIPGADAKPIIDIQVSLRSFAGFKRLVPLMEAIGYELRDDNPDLSKRYFREKPGARRTHIHMRCAGSWSEQFALLFRDYMRCHPEDVQQYGALKRQLAADYEDRQAYTDAKSPFIWSIMIKADAWSRNLGWQLGPSDV